MGMKMTVRLLILVAIVLTTTVNTSSYSTGFPRSNRKIPQEGVRRSRTTTELERIGSTGCSGDDIVVSQGQTAPLPNHIPTYTVHITNICSNRCGMYGIHLKCGWFSSTQLVNPKIFRRIGYNDCLVNDGRTIVAGGSISFQYSNTFSYPMAVSSFACGSTGAKQEGLD